VCFAYASVFVNVRVQGLLKPKTNSKGTTVVWKMLQAWVYAAALVAPTRTGWYQNFRMVMNN
jgi:hypothetical protein